MGLHQVLHIEGLPRLCRSQDFGVLFLGSSKAFPASLNETNCLNKYLLTSNS